jgi:large subunit ribosomal protein L21
MYAVIKAGGKQHRVAVGDVVEIELVHHGEDESMTFHPLLVVDDDGRTHVGKEVARAQVKARLAGEKKGEKVKVFKYRPKSGYAKTQGHRQMYTLVEVTDITLPKSRSSSPATKDEPAEAPPAKTAEPAAAPAEAADAPATDAE